MHKTVKDRTGTILLIASCCACAALLYARGMDNHFVSDDWVFLFGASRTNALSEAYSSLTFDTRWFVRPTQLIATWLVYQIGGLSPRPFHLASAAIDFANALLLAALVWQLPSSNHTSSRRRTVRVIATSALFLFSWRHHEVVFWYSSINELLATFFRLSSLLLILYSVRATTQVRGILGVSAALGAFALGILSKESALIFPAEVALLLALEYVVRKSHRKPMARYVLVLAPFVLLVGLWAALYLRTSDHTSLGSVERGGRKVLLASIPYLTISFLRHLNGNYIGTDVISRSLLLMKAELCILGVLSVLAAVRMRLLWLFALAWTCAAVVPYVMTVGADVIVQDLSIPLLGISGDRSLYYAAAGASLLLVVSGEWFFDEVEQLTRSGTLLRMLRSLGGLAVVVLVVLNVNRMIDEETDWEEAGRVGRDIVEQVQDLVPAPPSGSVVCIHNLPDNHRGKYVFRNGISEALYLAYSRSDFSVRGGVETWLAEEGCSQVFYYEEAPTAVVRSSAACEAFDRTPPQSPLVVVTEPMRDQVGVGPALPGASPVEDFGPGEQGFLWLGHGESEGLQSSFCSREQQEIIVRLEVSPGPSRDDAERTVELTVWGGDGEITERRSFEGATSLSFVVKLRPGLNPFQIVALDSATIPVQPNGDVRNLIVGLHEVLVAPYP